MTPADLSRTVLATVRRAVLADELRVDVDALPERIAVQRSSRPGCGDYATNVALQLAGPAGRSAGEVATILARRLEKEPGIAQVDVAAPGFLNITLHALAHHDVVREVREQREAYGRGDGLAGEAVTVTASGGPDAVRAPVVAEAVNLLLRAAGAGPGPSEPVRVEEPEPGILDGLGRDAARWALLRPPAEDRPRPTAELLRQHESNPLFRVRYAHARTRALLRNARDLHVDVDAQVPVDAHAEPAPGGGGTDPGGPPPGDPHHAAHHPAETELLGLVADFPRVVETAARRRAPDRVARHLERLADAFLRFHDECPALPRGDEKPSAVHAARVRLADAAGIVLADGLLLLGISAPDHL
ncbi:arginyl-tRNA synthetase [Actinacidiphila rubida]|uniref:arginine--tRNA ligase n=1 Tax=Actinacidiphila rubida TaxID=310780 RepID=A0A1H8MY28_9ACTN|nr:DALR anticodon-binding domain-containing protein [Actinacidiphila rubida]SEO22301.1 arginyl-tRNA synthetase [Actinacidiphila rubida]